MNYRVLCRFLGYIVGMLAFAMALCVVVDSVDIHYGRPHSGAGNGISCIVATLTAMVMVFIGRGAKQSEILRREAMAIVGLGWVGAAALGSLPFMLCDDALSPAQAFFESMSGFTTTGSTVITHLSDYPDSILFWRAFSQWIGGLGILVLFVALLAILGISGKRALVGGESSLNLSDAPMARLNDLATRLFVVYISLTLVCWAGLWGIGHWIQSSDLNIFEALLLSFATVSTGGFAPHDSSIRHYDHPLVECFLIAFMLISSLNMILLINIASGRRENSAGRTEAKAFLGMLAVVIVLIAGDLCIRTGASPLEALRRVAFPVVSMGSSTGFGTEDYDQWPLFSRGLLLVVMIVGGCSGSTAGGVKMFRIVLAGKLLWQEVIKSFRPQQVFVTRLDGSAVDRDFRARVLIYLVMIGAVLLVSLIVAGFLEPDVGDFTSSFGSVVATFFNMGPGFGDVGPTDNFAKLGSPALLFLSLLMLLGRLEIYVVLALFSRTLWRRY